jgi:SAM-dependent methyltransferase
MARNALLILLSAGICIAGICISARAQDSQNDPRKPDQLVRALELKRSDAVAVLEPEPFLAPLIADRVRSLVNFSDAPDHSVDVIVLYDVLHGIDRRSELYPKLRRALRLGGRLVNVDLSAELPVAKAVQEFTTAGFHITRTVSFLPLQYFLMFE